MNSVQKDQQSLAQRLQAVGSQVRLDILRLLVSSQEPMHVGRVAATTQYLQPRVSRHLHWLVTAGLVEKQDRAYVAKTKSIEELFTESMHYMLGDHKEEKR